MPITDWECDPDAKLTIPKELEATQRYRFTLGGDFKGQTGTFSELEYAETTETIRFVNVLMDTSDRAHGLLLKKRVQHIATMTLYHVPCVIVQL